MKNDFSFKLHHTCTVLCEIYEGCPLQCDVEETAYITDQKDYFQSPPIENQICVPYPDPESY